MPKAIAILIDPEGNEFYDAYGPMSTKREDAVEFASATVAHSSANRRFGRHDQAFWDSERTSRDNARREYARWSYRVEELDEDQALAA